MIINQFEDIVRRFPAQNAVVYRGRSMTYSQLNRAANRVAHALTQQLASTEPQARVSLMFQHGFQMLAAVIGALKAGKTYVPMDVAYPQSRLQYMMENSGAAIILSDGENAPLAQSLAQQCAVPVLNIDDLDQAPGDQDLRLDIPGDTPAYMLYTSGSTGRPKGLLQTHRNLLYFIRYWVKRLDIQPGERISFLASFSHDGALPDIFSALLSGACLFPFSLKAEGSSDGLYRLLKEEALTLWHSVPSLFRYFCGTLEESVTFPSLRFVILGGEAVRPHDLEILKRHFPNARLVNIYGQTESTVSSMCVLPQNATFNDVCLGEPPEDTEILLVNEEGDVVDTMGSGEIVVASDYIAPGYWREPEKTEEVFTEDEDMGRLYWTGDIGHMNLDGSIKFMGRKDFQVKIRGFRVETGELESVLMQREDISEAVVTAKKDAHEDFYLCAYIVNTTGADGENSAYVEQLRDYVASRLPEYMIPRYIVPLEKMPLNPNGKVHRKALPDPARLLEDTTRYQAPRNHIEETLAAIWQEVLEVERVGIDDNFIQLGGHSLLIITILSRIHRQLNVQLEIKDIFQQATIRRLAPLIAASGESRFVSIAAVEEKEYYDASFAQKRMYVMSRFNDIGTTYNISMVLALTGPLDHAGLEIIFRQLIRRHESLRTSFTMVGEKLVQVIHKEVPFEIPVNGIDAAEIENDEAARAYAKAFIRPFALDAAPLFRVGLVRLNPENHLLVVDCHHIVCDALSIRRLGRDFAALFNHDRLPAAGVRYRDYADWEARMTASGEMERQERYWLEHFKGKLPVLNLPLTYQRPHMQGFAGDKVRFTLPPQQEEALRQLVVQHETSMFMVILTIYYVLLAKLSLQEDIIVGTDVAGRHHADLENLVGMLVNTLALRNYPRGKKTFSQFLNQVKTRTLEALDHQDYQFDALVEKLAIPRNTGRNPLFDVSFSFLSLGGPNASASTNHDSAGDDETQMGENRNIRLIPPARESAMFDLILNGRDVRGRLLFEFNYNTALFDEETLLRFVSYFKAITTAVLDNPDVQLWQIEIVSDTEEAQLLNSLNSRGDSPEMEAGVAQDTTNTMEAEFDF